MVSTANTMSSRVITSSWLNGIAKLLLSQHNTTPRNTIHFSLPLSLSRDQSTANHQSLASRFFLLQIAK